MEDYGIRMTGKHFHSNLWTPGFMIVSLCEVRVQNSRCEKEMF